MGLTIVWSILAVSYYSAHNTFYWWGFRDIATVIPIRLWQWQLLHTMTWSLLVPGWSLVTILLLIRRSDIRIWRIHELWYSITLLITIAAGFFLADLFYPESERQVPRWIHQVSEPIVVMIIPFLICVLLLLYFLTRFGKKRHPF